MDASDSQKFVERFAEVVEVPPELVFLNTRFRDEVPYWSSLLGFGLLTMIQMDYSVVLPLEEFMKAGTVDDLRQAVWRHQQSSAQS